LGASSLLIELIGRRLAGWQRAPEETGGLAVWLGPA
jgi:hypothetical protein